MSARCHFEVLHLKPEQTTSAEVKKAYRSLCLQVHPDQCSSPDATEAFAKLKTSYEALESASGRTRHLMFIKRNPPKKPSVIAPFLEQVGSTKSLITAVAVFLAAEALRLAVADDAPDAAAAPAAAPAPQVVAPQMTRAPRAPAFSSNEGEEYSGYTAEQINDKVHTGLVAARERRAKKKREAAREAAPPPP